MAIGMIVGRDITRNLVIVPLLLAAAMTLSACTTGADEEESTPASNEAQARLIFNKPSFRQYLQPDVNSDGEIKQTLVIRLARSGESADLEEVGYLREEENVFVTETRWNERIRDRQREEAGDIFPHAIRDEDSGDLIEYVAFSRDLATILTIQGRTIGKIDHTGTIYRSNPDGSTDEMGVGSASDAVRLLFQAPRRVETDPDAPTDEEMVRVVTPLVVFEALDSGAATRRANAFTAQGLSDRGFRSLTDGNIKEAEADFERAIELDRNLTDAKIGLGNVRRLQGRLGEAIEIYTDALQEDPENWRALYNIGLAYLASRRLSDAEDALTRALDHAPRTAVVAIEDALLKTQ